MTGKETAAFLKLVEEWRKRGHERSVGKLSEKSDRRRGAETRVFTLFK